VNEDASDENEFSLIHDEHPEGRDSYKAIIKEEYHVMI